MSRSAKGSSFEREICRRLSEWWTDGARDDVFWRSAASGGRATVRSKQGKTTFGQYGDITAVDPIGQPLTSTLCIELKRGYSKFSFADAIDRPSHAAVTLWESFVNQAAIGAQASGAFAWLLVVRRDKREALAFFPWELWSALRKLGAFEWRPSPFIAMNVAVRGQCSNGRASMRIACVSLDDFLADVTPECIRELAQRRTSLPSKSLT